MVQRLKPLKTLSEIYTSEEAGELSKFVTHELLLTLVVEALVVEIPIKLASRVLR
jgi:hypothetical protein